MKKDGRTHDRQTKEAIRLMEVELILESEDVATVMASGRGRGARCLVARKGTGGKPKLTRAQKSQVFRWVNGKNPMQYGFDFALWTRVFPTRVGGEVDDEILVLV